MAEESMETLARSQLEMLYRMGILERCPEDDRVKISSRHDAFLAALPPPSAILPISSRMVRPPGDDLDSSRASSSKSGEFHSESSSDGSSYHLEPRRHRRYRQHYRTHESRALSSSISSVPCSNMSVPRPASNQNRRELRMWFQQWQHFVRYHHEKDRLQVIAQRFLKQSTFTKWARFLTRRRYEIEKKRLLDSWKIAKSIDRWFQWRQRRHHLRKLLNGGRRSFMGKIIQQRVWQRWIKFTKRRVFLRNVLTEKTRCVHRQLARIAWLAFRIYSLRARQDHLALRRCMQVLRDLQTIRQRRRLICFQHQEKINRKRKQSVLHHWTVFADASNCDRKLAWQVQFEVSRRRYLLLWWEAARATNHITQLQSKIASRMLAQHFYAWETATKAVQLGDKVRGRREKQLRSIHFKILRDQTRFRVHCKHVQLMINHHRLHTAVRQFHVWAAESKCRKGGVYQLQQKWRTRVLRWAWACGWQRNHCKRLAVKNAVKHAHLSLKARCFSGWKQLQSEWQAHYLQVDRADALYNQLCCRRSLAGWKTYYSIRRAHNQQLAQAEHHYQRHLLQIGVLVLWDAVYQNTQNSLRSHQLRQNLRTSLKRRYFRMWYGWTQSRLKFAERLRRLQRSLGFRKSICNLSRRTWNRWVIFTSICRKHRRCDQHFRSCILRRVLFIWHRYAKLESRLRAFDHYKSGNNLELRFGRWRCRTEQWKKLRVICELAEKVYERKLCTRVVRGWRSQSTRSHHVRECFESVKQQRASKLETKWFHVWKEQLRVRQCSSRLRYHRDRRRLLECFINWYKCSKYRKKLVQKFAYFQQIYGKYPHTSIVLRAWFRWQRFSTQSRYARHLRHRLLLKQVHRCWCHWQGFHSACHIFRLWRCAAAAASKSTNKLGTRVRCFRESRTHALQKRFFDMWKCMVRRNWDLQERQSFLKHQLNRELEGVSWRAQQTTRLYLKTWFRKWCIAQNKDTVLARHHFRVHLLQNAVLAWWKATVHSKQERVLLEAQQAITKLSYYHPQQEVYATRVRRKVGKRKQLKKTQSPKSTTNVRTEDMKKMRRMLDPIEQRSYSRSFQGVDKEILCHEYSGKILPAQDFVSSQGAEKSPFINSVPKAKLCSQAHSNQSTRVIQEGWTIFTCCDSNARRILNSVPEEMTCDQSLGSHESGDQLVAGGNKYAVHHSVSMEAINTNQNCSESRQASPCSPPEMLSCPESNLKNEHKYGPRSSNDKGNNMLPLFDNDHINAITDRHSSRTGEMEDTVTPQVLAKYASYPKQSTASFTQQDFTNNRQKDPSQVISTPFEAAQNDSSWGASEIKVAPRERHNNEQIAGTERCGVSNPAYSLTEDVPSNTSTVVRHRRSTMNKSRRTVHTKRIKVVASSKRETRPLDDMLQLMKGVETVVQIEVPIAGHTKKPNDPASDYTVFQEIVSFYVDRILAEANTNVPVDGSGQANAARMRVCFRMTRDLKLFQNDFYIDELQKIYDANFNERYIELPEQGHQAQRHEEQNRLELFLERLVESHPGYHKHVSSHKQNDSQLLSAPSWMVQLHLTPQLLVQKRARVCPQRHNAYWIWEPMPIAMDLALEKLLPAITKYIRVLGQFFLRQAIQGSSTADNPQDYRMSSAAFVNLMKQVQVFPQLFHRRELENAVRTSCCSSPEKEELNFPEFIEVLVRCSCSLRWGELDGGKQASGVDGDSTIAVIKFVMLIFAMEGQGSVLHKRNEDVNAILSFLGKQQQRQKAEKLLRFRKMLADNKHRGRTARKYQIPSVWSQVRLHFSPQCSPTKSHDTFAELTQSWDGGPPHHNYEPSVFDAQTSQPFGFKESPPQCIESLDIRPQVESSSCFTQEARKSFVDGVRTDESNTNPPLPDGAKSSTWIRRDTGEPTHPDNANSAVSPLSESTLFPQVEREKVSINTLESEEGITTEQHENKRSAICQSISSDTNVLCTMATAASNRLVEPMEKDDFLRDILNSIGDVELVLSHSKVTGNSSRLGRREKQPSYNTSPSPVKTNIPSLSDLAAESVLSDYFSDLEATEGMLSYEGIEQPEILVRDPMLNHLTDIDRFTESTDQTSLAAITGMARLSFADDSHPSNSEA